MTAAKYDAIADWYDARVRDGALLHDLALPALLDLCGAVAGRQVCDLACGQGVLARALAERGAGVIGVDVSGRLLAIARRYEADAARGIAYLHGDAQDLGAIPTARFDGVACNMSLMDIPNLAAALGGVARILRPGGWFVFSITHPCFNPPDARWETDADGATWRAVRCYFTEGAWQSANPDGVRGKVGAYHRMLGAYLNALAAAGLLLEQVREPRTTDSLAERVPGYREVPAILVARCRAPGGR